MNPDAQPDAQLGAELDAEPEAMSDTEHGAEPDIEPHTEAGCAVTLLDSNRRRGLNDEKTLFSVQNGITSLTLQVPNHSLSQPGFAQQPISSQIVFLQRNLPPLSPVKKKVTDLIP
jgi:hypothetical protein